MSNDDIRALCDWFLTCDRSVFPKFPFELTAYQLITGQLFFDMLIRETVDTIDYLDGNRADPPVRLASLLKDLQALKTLSFTQIDDDDDW
ncbi:MAG: hypothetical protein KME18_16725 [Phormidium tanganyikae FI6-MK23]|nr:hypothetical protein [Phormidium tanganyikae FI6-MK23]